MKHKLLNKLLFLTLLTWGGGINPAWADTGSITFAPNQATTGSNATQYVTTEQSFSTQAVTFLIKNWNPKNLQIRGNKTSKTNLQSGDNFYIHNTTAMPGNITGITITYTGGTIVATKTYAITGGEIITNQTIANSTAGTAGTNKVSWSFDGTGSYFAIGMDNGGTSGNTYCGEITIEYTTCGDAPTTYAVTYNANGATSGSVPTDNNAYSSGATVTVKGNTGNLAKTDHSFDGWNTAPDGTGTTYAADGTSSFTISAETTLYAKWIVTTTTAIDYSGITHTDVYSGTDAGSLVATVTAGGNAVPGATVTWSGNNNDVATINSSTGAVTLVGAGSVIFTASYAGVENEYQSSSDTYEMTVTNSTPQYNVTYKANGGTGDDIVATYYQGANVTVNGNTFTRSGYSFTKWNTQADGNGTDYLPNATINGITSNIDLYAQWEENNETTYDFTQIEGFSNWETGYAEHTVTYSDATVTFASANRQTSTITDRPVTKGGDVTLVLTDGSTMRMATFVCTQWTTKTQTITLYYSTDGGSTYTSTGVTSSNFTISKDNLPEGTNAVKITFSSTSNQVAITSATISKIVSTNPVIGADDVNLAYDDASGSIEYTLTNPVDGGVLSAAITGGNVGNWLSVGNPSNGSVALTCSANSANTARTATVTLTYTYNTNETVTKDVTITQAKCVEVFTLVKNSITSGKHYIIASGTDGTVKAMGSQNPNNRAAVGVVATTVENTPSITITDEEVYKFVIYGPDASGFYTIYDEANEEYLYAAGSGSGSNYLRKQESNDSNGKWSIGIDTYDGEATIVAQGDNTNKKMQYNSQNSIFSCYSSSQSPIYLYEKDGEATPTETVSVGNTGYTTYTTVNPVSFPSGVTAYIATQVNTNTIHLDEVSDAPARTPLVIHANEGNYTLTSGTSTAEVSSNILLSSDGTVKGNGTNYYALSTLNGTEPIGFYPVSNNIPIPTGKAYLYLTGYPTVKGFTFEFDDDADGINILTPALSEGEGAIYNLAGQRLNKMQKGINIINGKKVLK